MKIWLSERLSKLSVFGKIIVRKVFDESINVLSRRWNYNGTWSTARLIAGDNEFFLRLLWLEVNIFISIRFIWFELKIADLKNWTDFVVQLTSFFRSTSKFHFWNEFNDLWQINASPEIKIRRRMRNGKIGFISRT